MRLSLIIHRHALRCFVGFPRDGVFLPHSRPLPFNKWQDIFNTRAPHELQYVFIDTITSIYGSLSLQTSLRGLFLTVICLVETVRAPLVAFHIRYTRYGYLPGPTAHFISTCFPFLNVVACIRRVSRHAKPRPDHGFRTVLAFHHRGRPDR